MRSSHNLPRCNHDHDHEDGGDLVDDDHDDDGGDDDVKMFNWNHGFLGQKYSKIRKKFQANFGTF